MLGTIEICLLVIGTALLGGAVGWMAAARRHRQQRWPAAATGVVITMSALYAIYFFLALSAIGRWSC